MVARARVHDEQDGHFQLPPEAAVRRVSRRGVDGDRVGGGAATRGGLCGAVQCREVVLVRVLRRLFGGAMRGSSHPASGAAIAPAAILASEASGGLPEAQLEAGTASETVPEAASLWPV